MKLFIFAYKLPFTMFFTTPVELPCGNLDITHKSRLLLIGSCFAGNIGAALLDRKFNVDVNPFGVQYNPLSIATVLSRIVDGTPFDDNSPELFEHNGKWHSILHHSNFSRGSKEQLIEGINERLQKAHNAFATCDVIIITLGTAYAYTRNSDNSVAGNCHKLPGNCFTRSLLGIEEICDKLQAVMRRIIAINPGVKFMFTVSPIRHLRDGAHDNQKSKATLLLAIDRISGAMPQNTTYFPSYEIMMDELRDYRFYADDMAHPSTLAVEYIWERFMQTALSCATLDAIKRIEHITAAAEHRPFNPESEAHRAFCRKMLTECELLQNEIPDICLDEEKEYFKTYL